ncbi:alpha/beta hydrolase [Candidatus Villigracilis proximus]|uniref:alpha/beta hydrolase n=1 Tax=Candidatus Villigracilis proximus TaxID=3140683 RepID=UPI0031EBD4C6
MNHYETNWKAQDGLDIFAQGWEPTIIQPKAVVCLVHGLGEHSSRYAHVAEAFTKDGFVLFRRRFAWSWPFRWSTRTYILDRRFHAGY